MMQASTESLEPRAREPRVDLAADVRILTSGQSSTIQASTQNISESGMFVLTEDICSVNAELVCDVKLPNLNLPVRGRVVWVQTAPRPGMGIEFVDLNDTDLAALREVVAQGVDLPDQPGQPVKVWMEALPQAIRAEAVQTGQGVLLRSELSFLKLASPVLVYPADADQSSESYSGVLKEVSLTMNRESNAPVLLLHMHFAAEDQTQERQARVEAQPLSALPEEELAEIPVEVDAERFGADRICTPVEPEVDQATGGREPKVQVCDPELEGGDPSWELGQRGDPGASSFWALEGPEEAEPRRTRKRHPWLWSAALLMAGLAVASMLYTGLLPRAKHKALIWLTYAGLAEMPSAGQATPRAAKSKPAQAPEAPLAQERAEAPVPSNADLELASTSPASAAHGQAAESVVAAEKPGNYKIVTGTKGDMELVVLLKGSTKEAQSYRLGNPDGVAFNLPSARPQERYTSHRLDRTSAFRRVQIRRRSGGTQVRVLFWGSAPPYKIKVLPRQIRVTLLPDKRQAAGPSTTAM